MHSIDLMYTKNDKKCPRAFAVSGLLVEGYSTEEAELACTYSTPQSYRQKAIQVVSSLLKSDCRIEIMLSYNQKWIQYMECSAIPQEGLANVCDVNLPIQTLLHLPKYIINFHVLAFLLLGIQNNVAVLYAAKLEVSDCMQ